MRRLIEKYPLGYEGYLKERQLDAQAINAADFGKNAEVRALVIQGPFDSPHVPGVPITNCSGPKIACVSPENRFLENARLDGGDTRFEPPVGEEG